MKCLVFVFVVCALALLVYAHHLSNIGITRTDTSSICGDNLTWSYNESSFTITISGTGRMTNYD